MEWGNSPSARRAVVIVTSSSIMSSVPLGSRKSYTSPDVREDINLGNQMLEGVQMESWDETMGG